MKAVTCYLIQFLLLLQLLGNLPQANAASIEIKDTIQQNTIWNYDTIKIIGNLFLPQEYTLTIKPGTRVEFQGYYAFTFKGSVVAVGAPNDSIVFTINDTSGFHNISSIDGGWKGIKGDGPNYRSSYFEYCIFEYAKNLNDDYAISLGKPNGYNYKFHYNIVQNLYAKKCALYLGTSGVYNCIIRHNLCDAVYADKIRNCLIYNNKGNGASILLSDTAGEWEYGGGICTHNVIKDNQGFAIMNAINYRNYIANNLIDNNKGGINIDNNHESLIENNIISNNLSYGAINMHSESSWIFGNLLFNNSNQIIDTLDTISPGIHVYNTKTINIFNNTIIKNDGLRAGSLSLVNFTNAKVWNNILWENSSVPEIKEAVFLSDQPELTHALSLHSNLIKSGANALSIHPDIEVDSSKIFSADPKFEDYNAGDYSLISTSPCFNNGRNLTIPEFFYQPYHDLSGNYRLLCNIIDIGAYEFEPDSMLILNLRENDTALFCDNIYHSAYLRSDIYPDIYDQGPYTYQWQKDGSNIENAIYMDLYLENITENAFGKYSIIIAGYVGPTSTHSLYLSNTLGIIDNDSIVTYIESDITIWLTSLTDKNSTYQWFKDGIILNDTNYFIGLEDINESDIGYYYCVINNGCLTTYTDSVFLSVVPYCQLHPARDTIFNITICTGYDFNGSYLTASGTYYDTVPSFAGCDSLIILNLTVLQPLNIITVSSCNEYTFSGKKLTQTGIYYDTIPITNSCDSIVMLKLTILKTSSDTIEVVSCEQYSFNGRVLTETGTYFDTIPNYFGCDSIIVLNLTILEPSSDTIEVTACEKYSFNGRVLTQTGTYFDTIPDYFGCDSAITIKLTILEPSEFSFDTTVCYGFNFGGQFLTESSVYYDTIPNFIGCDSIITLNLNILEQKSTIIDEAVCVSYSFNDEILTESGTYYDTLISSNGCDSIIILNLTIQSAKETINIVSCSDFIYNENIYSESGTYIDTIYNETGCYTIVTLNLTIPEIDISITHAGSGLSAVMTDAAYQWINCVGSSPLIPGATDQNFIPEVSGNYAVIVTKDGCSDTSACYNFAHSGLDEENYNGNILIYPNPFSGSTTITISDESSEIDEISLVNMIGEEVFKAANIPGNTYRLKCERILPGTYLIIIKCSDKVYHNKIVIR